MGELAKVNESMGWMERLGYFWCRHTHSAAMWPIHGHYQCRICLRQFAVPYQTQEPRALPRQTAAMQQRWSGAVAATN